ncbi:MAG: PHP domain-containing protein [Oscillospiraceae bacterium]|nr:PHP domain-containing protein [Oscillospiraceae bacterium]
MAGDLHCHTRLSIGSMGIDDLLALAKAQGVTHLAIVDQDCMAGTVRARVLGERHGIQVLHGVEISCSAANGCELHLLCYLADNPSRLEGLCHQNIQARKQSMQLMVAKFLRRFPVSLELVKECAKGSTCVYPQHLMRALVESGLADQFCGELYHALFDPASRTSIASPATFSTPQEVLQAIHQAGGIAVLAHPGESTCALDMLDELIAAGLDGIEVLHPANSRDMQKQLLSIAKAQGMLVTGGSDFRGMYGTATVGQAQMNDAQLALLLSYKSRMKRKLAAKG